MLDFIISLHRYTYYQVIFGGIIGTIYGLVNVTQRRGFTDGFRSILYLVAGTGLLQAVWGMLLFLGGLRPNNILHLVYGGIVLLAIPAAFAYSSEEQTRRDVGVLTFAVFALFAAALRAYSTGPVGK